MSIIYLTLDQVLEIHREMLERYSGLAGIRDLGALESAIDAPKAAMFGQEMYKTGAEKGAVYLYHIIKNHPFNDGNKRTALGTWAAFYQVNEFNLEVYNKTNLENLCVAIAEGKIKKEDLITFFTVSETK